MAIDPFLISLPIADRPRSYAFYQEALGLEAIGEPADDGVPDACCSRSTPRPN